MTYLYFRLLYSTVMCSFQLNGPSVMLCLSPVKSCTSGNMWFYSLLPVLSLRICCPAVLLSSYPVAAELLHTHYDSRHFKRQIRQTLVVTCEANAHDAAVGVVAPPTPPAWGAWQPAECMGSMHTSYTE